jgi:Uma2 family endonuclease
LSLPSVEEIWLVDSRRRAVQLWRRGGPDRWIVTLPITGNATFASEALGGEVGLDALYRGSGL